MIHVCNTEPQLKLRRVILPIYAQDGSWEVYCCFCSGPLNNARDNWIDAVMHRMRIGALGSGAGDSNSENDVEECDGDDSIPTEVTISERDGAVWERCVCVTPEASESFVSPLCTIEDDWRIIIDVCLAFISRHNSISPQELWKVFFEGGYRRNSLTGKINSVDYYEIGKRYDDMFDYDEFSATTSSSETSHELEWLLSRPTYLPIPQDLHLVTTKGLVFKPGYKVFDIPELFDNILKHIVDVPLNNIASELEISGQSFEAPSVVIAAQTLLSLAQVNRSFYHAIVGNRQGLFLKVMRNFGWMLPFSPADW
ncbi:hypothetical protein FSPOR_10317 [Fusarium sporotrichioides]|uniref:Uncharacterized protein n=1 Tax=Fusarium sporotrichioides TaxID=5514 RepID=A0A395RLS1_FUSSP|nr:hypothetical protein FSPOR_10317 [Fusarium sporotrichioides]